MRERILILEDMDSRRIWFRDQFIGKNFDIVKSAQEAIALLKKYDYSDIFLDHDLLEKHYASEERDDENTGYAVALFLEKYPNRSPNAQIIVHSQNPSGSARMIFALKNRNARWIKFPELKLLMRVHDRSTDSE